MRSQRRVYAEDDEIILDEILDNITDDIEEDGDEGINELMSSLENNELESFEVFGDE